MATPPWLEGQNAGHFSNSLAQPSSVPSAGLTALERMLDATPCGPKPEQLQSRTGEPQYCQPWSTASSQLSLEPPLYSTANQWYTPGGSQDYSPYPGQNEINYNYQQPVSTNTRYVPPGNLQAGPSINGSQVQEVPNQYYNPPQLSQPPSGSGSVSDQPWWFSPDGRSSLSSGSSTSQRYHSPFNIGSPGYYESGYPPPPQHPAQQQQQQQQQQQPQQPQQQRQPPPQQQAQQQQQQQQQQQGPPPTQASLYNQSIPQSSNFNSGAPSPQTSYPQPQQFEPFGYPNPLLQPPPGQSGGYYESSSYCDPNAYSRGSVKNEPMNVYSSSQNLMMPPFGQQQPSTQGYASNSNSSVGQQQYPPSNSQASQMLSPAQQAVGAQLGTQQSPQRTPSATIDAKKPRRRSRKGKDASLLERPVPQQPQPVMGNQPPISSMNMGSYTHPMGPPPSHTLDPYMNPYANQGGYPLDERVPVNPQQMTNYPTDQYIPADQHLGNKRPGSEMMDMSDSPTKRMANAYQTNGMMTNPHMMNGMYQPHRPPEIPQGEDNSRDYSKEDLAEKDDSTQESTNTLESAKTENDDDDKGGVATNGENSKDPNNSSSTDKEDSKKTETSGEDDDEKKSKLPLRKNIKDIKDEASLDERTKIAQKEEQERIKRLQEQRMRALNSLKELRGSVPTPYQSEPQTEDQEQAEPCVAVKQEEPSPVPAIVSDEEEDDDDKAVAALKKDVIDISSGDEDGPHEKDVINVSDDSDEEDEEIDFSSSVHPMHDEHGRVLINVGHADDEEDIFIAPQLSHIIKPHQINGVRFLYENVVESTSRFNTTNGFGCILAHSMGLGKTIQVITFTDLFLRHTTGRKVLIITPINTIQNWQAEFDKWLPREDQVYASHINEGHVRPRNFFVFLLNETYKTASARHRIVKEWHEKGGVMLMGYEMYRTLALKKVYKPRGRKKAATVQATEEVMRKDRELLEEVYEALVNPGPDLVVCDEGHRIKNCNATTSSALKDIKTKRRVVLTGYPLQNNLLEYWCMVDFVRPSYLGTKMEFTNMFERPIQNGQCVDSTPKDRQLMKFRAHVLHSLLMGFVQRRGHGVLKDALPHKEEHVFFIRMTPIQRELYTALVKEFVSKSESANPLKIFAVCCKIWNHPDILYNLVRDKKGLPPTAVMDLDIDDGAAEVGEAVLNGLGTRKNDLAEGGDPEADEDPTKKKRKRGKKKDAISPSTDQSSKPVNDDELNKISYEWAYELMSDYKADDINNSYKMVLLMEVIDSSLRLGDKLLVFSQSLLTLDLVERFLQMRDLPPRPGLNYTDKWVKNRTYFRLDGGTSGQDREKLINDFNHNPCVALFLLSTRAGCLGINLIGANRIVVLDASWNPCHDAQAVCRVYRYGQQKPCYIYRFVCDNSLEKRIYDRQVNKQGMSDRVVDEMNPEAKLTWKDVSTLIQENESDPPEEDFSDCQDNFKDPIMKQVVSVASKAFTKLPFEHESLLLDNKDQKLTKQEKKLARASYEQEKRANQLSGRGTYTSGITTMNGRMSYVSHGSHVSHGGYGSRYGFKTGSMVSPSFGVTQQQQNVGTALIHSLVKQGMTVQKMRLPKTITIGLSKEPPIHLQAGCELFVMKTPRGVYLRLPCERVIAMRLPQTLDQLCMARPSPFRPAAEIKKPEVINLDDEDDELSSDFDDIRPKPKVITIESETISKNKGLYDMLTKDYRSTKQEEEDILGKMAANKNLQLQVVTEAKPERKARIKITQRKKIDKEMAKGQLLNGETTSGYEGDSDSCRERCEANSTEDEEAFDLGSLSGEITVSPVKMSNTRPNRSSRKDEQVDLDADEGAPSSNENSQGSGSDNSTEVKRNPLAIQNLEEMLGGTKSAPPPAATIQ